MEKGYRVDGSFPVSGWLGEGVEVGVVEAECGLCLGLGLYAGIARIFELPFLE